MKIYISATFENRNRIRPYRDVLWHLGHEITSTWLDEVAKPVVMAERIFRKKLALKDVAEIVASDAIILDTFNKSQGKCVEFGIALGRFQSKLLFTVGPKACIFYELADENFKTWKECLLYFSEQKND